MPIPLRSWLDLIERDYFTSFLPAGGGAIRFAVGKTADIDRILAASAARAAGAGLLTVGFDLAQKRLQMLQNVVAALAAAVAWDDLTGPLAVRLVEEAGYRFPDPKLPVNLNHLAEANQVAPQLLRRDISLAMSRAVWRDAALTQDFRNGMLTLLNARLTGENAPAAALVLDWLKGQPKSVAALRGAGIGRKIDRQNARATLSSLCHWLRRSGVPGVLLSLDIRQVLRERREAGDGLIYTPSAVWDCYEVLRQMIDSLEALPGLFVLVAADERFLGDDPRRALNKYTALAMRVSNDVRPEDGENPLSPLVRIAA